MAKPQDQEEYKALIRFRLEESVRIREGIIGQVGQIAEIAALIVSAYKGGKKLLLFGNGGSAADAQHIAAELVGRCYLDRPSLPAEALTTNTSSLTAIGNDYSFSRIFARQVEALGQPGDIAIGISTSGNSENVIQGILAAKAKGLISVGLTGQDGGRLKDVVDYCIRIPSQDTARIQEGHILVGHILCEIVEQELFAPVEEER